MRYTSTRGDGASVGFEEAVMAGLAPDGGLFVPVAIPDVSALLPRWSRLSFVDLAVEVVRLRRVCGCCHAQR